MLLHRRVRRAVATPEAPGDDGAVLLPQVLRARVVPAARPLRRRASVSIPRGEGRGVGRVVAESGTRGHGVRYAGKSRAPLDESSERDVKRSVVMAERAVLYARRGVSFRPSLRADACDDRRIDGVSRRWRDGIDPHPLHAIDAAGRWRVARRGTARRRREGGEEHTHIQERIQQDARRP